MLDIQGLLDKHRSRGVLVDTNLLVLYLVGQVNRQRIRNFKRTENFTVEDFDILTRLIARFDNLITTPHILSQVSDLAKLDDKEFQQVRQLLKLTIEQIVEVYDESRAVVSDRTFERFGLTDAAIATVCSREVLVVTADFRLYGALQQNGGDAINFNHVRAMVWN